MPKSLEEARKELDEEFSQHRDRMGEVERRLADVNRLGPTDDIYEAMDKLLDAVKEATHGGLIGTGAKGHRDALEDWKKAGGK